MIKNIFSILALALCLICHYNINAQTGSFGNTYIQSNSALPVYGELFFGNSDKGEAPGTLNTNKGSDPGVITFYENASWENANDFQHINGFVSSYSIDGFTFPIGDLGFYRPLIVSGDVQGTTAAYFLDNPKKNVDVVTVQSRSYNEVNDYEISDLEYWKISGDKAVNITLTYDVNSSISDLTEGDLSKLRIIGWTGSQWEVIPSDLDNYQSDISSSKNTFTSNESTLSSGSITTKDAIVPNEYQLITFGIEARNSDAESEIEFNTAIINDELIEFTLFPNPTLNLSQLNIDYKLTNVDEGSKIVVFDALGQIVYQQELEKSKDIYKLPFSETTSGTYHVGVVTQNGSRLFKPVIVLAK
jgi:hypothetical protein